MRDEGGHICDSCGEEIVLPIDLSAGSEGVRRGLPRLLLPERHSR
jgi:hypothetical protein